MDHQFPRSVRLRELAARYAASPQYADDRFLERYAHKHRAELLSQRDEIVAEYVMFDQDRMFVAFLKATAPHLLAFATWRAKALQHADALEVEDSPETAPAPEKRRLTEEELLASIQRKRHKMLFWERVKAEDEWERLFQQQDLAEGFVSALQRRFQLHADDLDKLLTTFRRTLLEASSEQKEITDARIQEPTEDDEILRPQ